MFERYTEKARRVIFFARYEASQFGSPYIETEHLLLGLLREDKALTNRFLRSHASVESIRKQIEGHTTIREKVSTSVDLPLSNECKRVLAYAAEEAGSRISTLGQSICCWVCCAKRSALPRNFAGRELRCAVRAAADDAGEDPPRREQGQRGEQSMLEFSRDLTQRQWVAARSTGRARCRSGSRDQILCRRTNNPVLIGEPGVVRRRLLKALRRRLPMVRCQFPGGQARPGARSLLIVPELITAGSLKSG